MRSSRPFERLFSGAWRRAAAAALIAGGCLVSGPAALAKRPAEGSAAVQAAESKSYILPYALVILSIALGVTAVCRGNARADKEIEPEDPLNG